MHPANDLLRPHAFPPGSAGAVELRETHASWVFLTERDVYKVKKPVVFSFLDYGTIEARRRACDAEVALNRRLAPRTYLGVVPVRIDASGRATFVGDGPIVDWAVHMERLPDTWRADLLLENGTLGTEQIDEAAIVLARFHAAACSDEATTAFALPSAIAQNVRDNFDATAASASQFLTPAEVSEIEACQLGFLEDHRRAFEGRLRDRRIREGHGDLRLEHLYFDHTAVTVLDCIEFSSRFRCADVCADIAFLSMDLAAHRRVDLAERLLATYAREANDYALYDVVDFYEAYRAHVRAKVALIVAGTTDGEVSGRALAEARKHFALALACNRRSLLRPVVVAVGGLIASGKSTVARAVADRLSCPIIDADRTRKHILGVAPFFHVNTEAFKGAYDPAVTKEVYAQMMWNASHVLASGRPVVLDASFRTAEMRRSARELAREHGVPFLMVECRASEQACRKRLEARALDLEHVSDGRLEVFDAFVARGEAMTELSDDERLVVDTERPLAQTVAAIDRRVVTWPLGMTA